MSTFHIATADELRNLTGCQTIDKVGREKKKTNKTNNIDTVRNCQKEFAFELPSIILARHSEHFLIKYNLV